MIGVVLASLSSLFEEIFNTIGKTQVAQGRQSVYTMAFLALAMGVVAFVALSLFQEGAFYFSLASLPTFIPRVVLEIFQAYFLIAAITKADRTTFSFIRVGTIPLLLGVDVALGYTLKITQIIAIIIIFLTIILLVGQRTLARKGMVFVILSTVNAVVTVSLLKYDITHFNSVAAEQGIVLGILILIFFLAALLRGKENPLRSLVKPLSLVQSLSAGASIIAVSFALTFAPASVIMAAVRSSAMLWALISGKVYFGEIKTAIKFLAIIPLVLGIILLMI